MTKDEMLALVQGQLDAYNRGDLEKYCSFFHPEVRTEALIAGTTGSEGMDQFREGYGKLFADNPKLHCETKSRIVLEHAVIEEEWVTGAARFPEGLHTVVIFGFRDGKIDRMWTCR